MEKGARWFKDKLLLTKELLVKVRNLPFDRLRVNGLRLKLFNFSVRGELVEPQKNTFARASHFSSLKKGVSPRPRDSGARGPNRNAWNHKALISP